MANNELIDNQDREKQSANLGPRSKLDWNGFLYYLGYDLEIRADVDRLFKNFIYLEKERVKSEKKVVRRSAIIVTIMTAFVTGFITVSFTWLFNSGWWHTLFTN